MNSLHYSRQVYIIVYIQLILNEFQNRHTLVAENHFSELNLQVHVHTHSFQDVRVYSIMLVVDINNKNTELVHFRVWIYFIFSFLFSLYSKSAPKALRVKPSVNKTNATHKQKFKITMDSAR